MSFFFFKFSFYNQCCILQFITFWVACKKLIPPPPFFFPPKASQVNIGGSLVTTCLDTKNGCLCVQEATEGLCTPGSQEGTQRLGRLAERSPHVGRRRRRVCVEKALERRRNPREVAFSSTLLLIPVH